MPWGMQTAGRGSIVKTLFVCTECVILTPGNAAEPDRSTEVASAAPQAGKEPAPIERIEDIHKPSIIAFQSMIHTFVRARQLK